MLSSTRLTRSLLLVAAIAIASCGTESDLDLSPSSWPQATLEAYLATMEGSPLLGESESANLVAPSTNGNDGLVAATSSAFAVHAGAETLRQGGNAADAAIAVAMAQVTAHAGGATSYAGQVAALYFEAATGKVHRIDGGYAVPLGETDPTTIPPYGTPSGRAVLVPGFMAGIEALHQRCGNLPLADRLEPAIYIADQGYAIGPTWAMMMRQRKHVITRLPEGRAIFTNADGTLLGPGDQLRQPQVAAFLRRIASEGTDYMYRGPWAGKFVDAVNAQGGHMSLEDLDRYEPIIDELQPSRIREFDVYAPDSLIEELRLAELADLRAAGHYTESADALYWLMMIARVSDVIGPHIAGSGLSSEEVESLLPDVEVSEDQRFTKENAAAIWAALNSPAWEIAAARAEEIQLQNAAAIAKLIKDFSARDVDEDEAENEGSRPDHTAGIITVDTEGNMVALVHSVTSAVWGEVGICVGGVSVVDPGAFAQDQMLAAGPGNRLADGMKGLGTCPAIIAHNGRPLAGCGAVGASFDVVGLQAFVNYIEFGLTPAEIGATPMFRKNWPPGQPVRQPVGEGEFTRDMLAEISAMGIDIVPAEDPATATHGGIVVLGGWNTETDRYEGAVTSGSHSRINMSNTGLVEALASDK